jgi:hypothetical protein
MFSAKEHQGEYKTNARVRFESKRTDKGRWVWRAVNIERLMPAGKAREHRGKILKGAGLLYYRSTLTEGSSGRWYWRYIGDVNQKSKNKKITTTSKQKTITSPKKKKNTTFSAKKKTTSPKKKNTASSKKTKTTSPKKQKTRTQPTNPKKGAVWYDKNGVKWKYTLVAIAGKSIWKKA